MSNRDLTDEQIRLLQATIKGSGALDKVEQMIDELGTDSLTALKELQLDEYGKEQLEVLARKVVNRQS